MMVTLEHHRTGIGSALPREAQERLFEQYESIFLHSFRDNHQTNRYYKKHGWMDMHRDPAETSTLQVRSIQNNQQRDGSRLPGK